MIKRQETYKILQEVLFKDRHAHLVLKEVNLDPNTQKFVSALTYTVLQNYLYLEYQIEDLIDNKLDRYARLLLVMGVAELLKMDGTPDYAVVNNYVDLSKKVRLQRFSGLINAVLKKVNKRGPRPIEGDTLQVASIEYSMPLWIMKLLKGQYDETYAIEYAKYCANIKPNYVRFNSFKPSKFQEDLFEEYGEGIIAKAAFFRSDYLENGYAVVQDINSQKVVPHLDLKEGHSVIDACCGPGTKTLQISNLLNNTGRINGIELYESRTLKTQELMNRCGVVNAYIETQDVLDYVSEKLVDRILVDAPCSGLGVLAHKHDLRYHIKPEELDDLEEIQRKMLAHLAPQLKTDGIMVYATCTLNKKENGRQIQTFLETHENFVLLEEKTYDPHTTLGDGFYVAKLHKKW